MLTLKLSVPFKSPLFPALRSFRNCYISVILSEEISLLSTYSSELHLVMEKVRRRQLKGVDSLCKSGGDVCLRRPECRRAASRCPTRLLHETHVAKQFTSVLSAAAVKINHPIEASCSVTVSEVGHFHQND